MSTETVGGVEITRSGKMSAEEEREYKAMKNERAQRLAAMLEETPVDWEAGIDKVKTVNDGIDGHLDDAYAKLAKDDYR